MSIITHKLWWKRIKTKAQVGTHTSPSIHKFLYTPSVRDRDQPQQQKPSSRANDVSEVERRRNFNHHQEMDFRYKNTSVCDIFGLFYQFPSFSSEWKMFPFFSFCRLSHDGAISPLESNGLLKSKETVISLDYVWFTFHISLDYK